MLSTMAFWRLSMADSLIVAASTATMAVIQICHTPEQQSQQECKIPYSVAASFNKLFNNFLNKGIHHIKCDAPLIFAESFEEVFIDILR